MIKAMKSKKSRFDDSDENESSDDDDNDDDDVDFKIKKPAGRATTAAPAKA